MARADCLTAETIHALLGFRLREALLKSSFSQMQNDKNERMSSHFPFYNFTLPLLVTFQLPLAFLHLKFNKVTLWRKIPHSY